MSKNNSRGISLVRWPILGIHSLTLIVSCFTIFSEAVHALLQYIDVPSLVFFKYYFGSLAFRLYWLISMFSTSNFSSVCLKAAFTNVKWKFLILSHTGMKRRWCVHTKLDSYLQYSFHRPCKMKRFLENISWTVRTSLREFQLSVEALMISKLWHSSFSHFLTMS